MTETAATTGTSAGSSAERKPADDSGFTEEATQPQAATSDEPTLEAPGTADGSATGSGSDPGSDPGSVTTDESATVDETAIREAAADPSTRADRPPGDEPTVALDSDQAAAITPAAEATEVTVESEPSANEATAERSAERRSATGSADYRSGAFGDAGSADPDAYLPNGSRSSGGSGGGAEPSRRGFTRPPGMVPPPERPDEVGGTATWEAGGSASSQPGSAGWTGAGATSGTYPPVSATAPVSAPPRVTGRIPASGVAFRQAAADTAAAAPHTPVSEPVRPRPAATPRGPRRARLNLKRVDPWSVMKFSFAVSLVMFVVVIVAASVLYLALDAMGVFASINTTVGELVQSGAGEGGDSFQITARGVIGTAAVLGALNVLLFTSLATLGAFIYNVCADLVGGVEVTLAERD